MQACSVITAATPSAGTSAGTLSRPRPLGNNLERLIGRQLPPMFGQEPERTAPRKHPGYDEHIAYQDTFTKDPDPPPF